MNKLSMKYFKYKNHFIVIPFGNNINKVAMELSNDSWEIIKLWNVTNSIDQIVDYFESRYETREEAKIEISNFIQKFEEVLYKTNLNGSTEDVDISLLTKLSLDRHSKNKPYKVFLELTHTCNLRCPHCYLQHELVSKFDYPSKEKIFQLLDELEKMEIVILTITGGECTLHPDFYEIIEYASKKNFLLVILTNGQNFNENNLEKLKNLDIYDIRISLYGNELIHDQFVNKKGAYKKVINSLKYFQTVKGIGHASFVVTVNNYKCFDEVIDTFRKEKIQLLFSPNIMPITDGDMSTTKLRISRENLETLYKKIPNFRATGSNCSAGIGRYRITPSGAVNPCEMIRDVIFGNVFEDGMAGCLNSVEHKNWILFMDKFYKNHSCFKCENRKYCTICPGVFKLETGDYFSKSDFSCEMASIKKKIANNEKF